MVRFFPYPLSSAYFLLCKVLFTFLPIIIKTCMPTSSVPIKGRVGLLLGGAREGLAAFFGIILRNPFYGWPTSKVFQRCLWRQFNQFWGGAHVEKDGFLILPFFGLCFDKFAHGSEFFLQNKVSILISDSSENQIDQPKKSAKINLEKFRKKSWLPRKLYTAFVCSLGRCHGKGLALLAVLQISLGWESTGKELESFFFIHKLHD